MRLRKADLRRRINGDIAVRASDARLSSHAGLEAIRRYFSQIGLAARLRQMAVHRMPASDFGSVSQILLLMALMITGGRRLRHIEYFAGDPMVERFCSLKRLPTSRSVGRWLSGFDADAVDTLRRVNEQVCRDVLQSLELPRLTIDVDGSVVSTGLQTQGARRGFNPHRRKVPSYYPITAYEANSGMVLAVQNRSGNVHDGKASVAFIGQMLHQRALTASRHRVREMRLDGAFFRADVLNLLDRERVEYAIKVPFHGWLGLKERILARRRWRRVNDEVDCFVARIRLSSWQRTERITIYRRLVNHPRCRHFQLDLFDPDDGHYEYSAVASNKSLSGRALWAFMNGRGTHEKVYGELKSGFAFATVPTQTYHGNSAWQVLSVLAFNLTRGMQTAADSERRPKTQKRRSRVRFSDIRTMRYRLINRAGLLLNRSGRQILDLGSNHVALSDFLHYSRSAENAA